MLGLDPLRFAGRGLPVGNVSHPQVTTGLHGHIRTRAFDHQHMFNAVAAAQGQGFIDDGFQRQLLATTHLLVGGDDHLGAGIFDAIPQALRRETAKHHRVGSPYASTSLHGGHALDGHGDVNDDAVTFLDAQLLHRIGDLAGTRQQLRISGTGDFAAIGFKDDGCLVAQTFVHMAI